MSNTSEVTPYESAPTQVAQPVTDPVTTWLESKMSEAVGRHRDEDRRQRLSHTVLPLRLRKPATLLQSAESLGYKLRQVPTKKEPVYLLERGANRIAIMSTRSGRLQIQSAEESVAQELVTRHTTDRTLAHFTKKGMKLSHKSLPNGEIEITAQERMPSGDDGTAKLSTIVHRDGRVSIDVSDIRGNRCDQLVHEYADALGGRVTGARYKDAYDDRVRIGRGTRV
jgi:hypothetical protein